MEGSAGGAGRGYGEGGDGEVTQEEQIAGLMKIAGFFKTRADMAVGDAKMLLNWMKCAEEAANMMQERKACLLSLEEYRAIAERPLEERVPVWLEWRGGSGRWAIPERAYQGYGVNWRCWTWKPSNEQRRAETWT